MKRFLMFFMLVIFIFTSGTVFAREVTVEGFGKNRDEALRRAEQSAVEEVVGTFIDSRTLVENSMLKLDEIYSASQGFVSNVKILSESKNNDGLYSVKVRLNVESEANTELMSKLETIMRLNDPKISVVMLKDNLVGVHDELAESALNEKLLTLGFSHVLDVDLNSYQLEKIYNDGNLNGVDYGVDYLVIGKTHVSAQNIQLPDYKNGGYIQHPLNSGTANITAKIIRVKSNEIVETINVSGTNAGPNRDIAEQNAIRRASESAATELEKKFKKLAMSVGMRKYYR